MANETTPPMKALQTWAAKMKAQPLRWLDKEQVQTFLTVIEVLEAQEQRIALLEQALAQTDRVKIETGEVWIKQGDAWVKYPNQEGDQS